MLGAWLVPLPALSHPVLLCSFVTDALHSQPRAGRPHIPRCGLGGRDDGHTWPRLAVRELPGGTRRGCGWVLSVSWHRGLETPGGHSVCGWGVPVGRGDTWVALPRPCSLAGASVHRSGGWQGPCVPVVVWTRLSQPILNVLPEGHGVICSVSSSMSLAWVCFFRPVNLKLQIVSFQ